MLLNKFDIKIGGACTQKSAVNCGTDYMESTTCNDVIAVSNYHLKSYRIETNINHEIHRIKIWGQLRGDYISPYP